MLKCEPEFPSACAALVAGSGGVAYGFSVMMNLHEIADKYDMPKLSGCVVIGLDGALDKETKTKKYTTFWAFKNYISSSHTNCVSLQKIFFIHARDNLSVLRKEEKFQELLKVDSMLAVNLLNDLAVMYEKQRKQLMKAKKG